MIALDRMYLRSVVEAALAEDVGSGDITTLLTIPEGTPASGEMIAKQEGVLAGLEVVRAVYEAVDSEVNITDYATDGMSVSCGQRIVFLSGTARSLLTGERVALNFLQRLSGIAALTSRYVRAVAHTKARIVDTRKTTPGLRRLEKYAVTVGGGFNHRFGLDDGILIKDNHIAAAGGITAAVSAAKKLAPHTLRIEVEIASLNQLDEAIGAGADLVLLDNMDLQSMRNAVDLAAGRVLLEASGGVNLEAVTGIAETGVDIISVGALTHSAPALDISLNFRS